MTELIASVTFVVRDYDEAIRYFTGPLGFRLLEDAALGADKRWVRVAPDGAAGTSLLLARAASPEEEQAVGRQGGGRVGFFLQTDDFDRTYEHMRAGCPVPGGASIGALWCRGRVRRPLREQVGPHPARRQVTVIESPNAESPPLPDRPPARARRRCRRPRRGRRGAGRAAAAGAAG